MITAEDVQHVARTGKTYDSPEGALTVGDIIHLTTARDWSGVLVELHFTAASDIAAQWNRDHPEQSKATPAKVVKVPRKRSAAIGVGLVAIGS